jgi:hypothetical protein
MASYHVDINGNVTKNDKKKKKNTYSVSLDGKVTKHEVEEIAPTKGGNGYFKQSEGNVGEAVVGTGADVSTDFLTGALKLGEGIIDGLLTIAPYVAQGQYYQNGGAYQPLELQKAQNETFEIAKKGSAEMVAKDIIDEETIAKNIIGSLGSASYMAQINQGGGFATLEQLQYAQTIRQESLDYLNNKMESHSVLDEKSDAIVESVGQFVATQGLNMVGVPWFLTTGLSVVGSETENALVNNDATFEEATASGLISAGGELLSELAFGGTFTKTGLDDWVLKKFTNRVSNKLLNKIAKVGVKSGGEGLEEIFSELVGKVGKKLTYEDEKTWAEILASEEALEDYLDAFIGGAVVGGISNTGQAIHSEANGVDYLTENTHNEQKVIEAEVQNRVEEKTKKDGKKPTDKEIADIREQVQKAMERGAISIDTIEKVLGGEDYNQYTESVKKLEALQKEQNTLGKKSRPTLEQTKRYNKLDGLIEEAKQNTANLKQQLSTNVSEIAKNDRLSEAYLERIRATQNIEIDASSYKSESAKKTAENFMKSELIKNTHDAHDFVDLALRIAEDKNIEVIATTTQRLMESKANGNEYEIGDNVSIGNIEAFVTKDNKKIIINMDANKSLTSLTGHEITHTFEKANNYDALQKVALRVAEAKGELKARQDSINSRYAKLGLDEKAKARELTADIIGDYLFSDSEFVRNLAVEEPNVFKRIWNEIKYLCKMATAGSREARELERLKHECEIAWAERNNKTTTDEGIKLSYSSMANTFYGDASLSTKDFENGNYKNTEGYKKYVDECVNNMRQTRTDFDEVVAREEVESAIEGIVEVALASKKAGYDIFDDNAKRDTKDSKNRSLFSSLEPNSDYFTSHDVSTICDKSQNFTEIYDEIVRREEQNGVPRGKRFFDKVDNYFYLHKVLAEKGLTQPCRQCYVDSMRKNLTPMAEAFLTLVNETDANNKANAQLYNKGNLKTNNAKIRESVRELLAESSIELTLETLTTEDGLAQLRLQEPLIYEAFNSFYGQSKPKMPKSATPFRFGELTAMLTDENGKIKQSLVDKINSTGGFRLQSYSDFQIQNFVDILQVIHEAGTLGLSGHAYTKVPAFLEATEGTNLKRNISIFMYKDGNEWKIDKNDSFPYELEEIYNIVNADKSGNTSIIVVSQNADHSAWIMANDNIGYAIPFHKSGHKMGTVRNTIVNEGGREIKGYKDIKDHTRQQTEVWKETSYKEDGTIDHKKDTKVKKTINIYEIWDFDNKDNLSKIDLIKKNLMAYIDACNEAGYQPKFREYVMNNAQLLNDVLKYAKELGTVSQDATIDDISFEYEGYRIPYGYYKFLGDFGMFTPSGEASPINPLSLNGYNFDNAKNFFADAKELRRNEILQQFANGEERQKYRDSDLSAEELQDVLKQKRQEVVDDIAPTRYSLADVEAIQPTTSKWKRTLTTEEAKARFPKLWDVTAEESEVRNPTQISSTVNSYRKVYDFLETEGFDGTILDASSGLGYGTKAGIEEYGFNVDDIEPYPDKDYNPKYTDYSTLHNKYDVIISNAVLNVLPQDQRDALVVKMGELLNDGGRMFINVRGKDVDSLANNEKNTNISPMEWYVESTGSYQKGFTKAELVAYLQDALGEGYTVEPTNMFGAVSTIVTKKAETKYSLSDSDGRDLSKEQIEYFKDSKARDENGNLKVVYHSSKTAGFTVFDGNKGEGNYRYGDYGSGITFFTDNKDMADSYDEANEGGQYEGYLNITNPYVIDAQGRDWNKVTKEYSQELYDSLKSITEEEKNALIDLMEWDDWGVFKDEILQAYNRGQSGDLDAYTQNLGTAYVKANKDINALFHLATEDFSEEAIKKYAHKPLTTNDIVKNALEDGSYDGVIIKDVRDYGGHIARPYAPTGNVYVMFNSNQFKRLDNTNPTSDADIRYSLSDDIAPSTKRASYGYHAGDLGKAESLAQQGYGRDTGHFGTGTYFVGNEEAINIGSYKGRPHEKVDFSKYNLYKVYDSDTGYRLHDFLRGVDGFFNLDESEIRTEREWKRRKDDLEYAIFEEEISEADAIKEAKILFGEYDFGRVLSNMANEPEGKWIGFDNEGTLYLTDKETYRDEEIPMSDLHKYVDVYDVINRLIYDNRYVPRIIRNIESWDDSLDLNSIVLFGKSKKDILGIINEVKEEIANANYSYEDKQTVDSASTRFMKKLGYEGIDVRGTSLDNTTYGSVIYDLKGEDLARKQEIGTAKFRLADDKAPKEYGDFNIYGKDIRLNPQEEVAPTDAFESDFAEDYAPLTETDQALENILKKREEDRQRDVDAEKEHEAWLEQLHEEIFDRKTGEDIEGYETIKGRFKHAEYVENQRAKNKVVRADSKKVQEAEDKVAEILDAEPVKETEAPSFGDRAMEKFVDKGYVFEKLAKKTKNRELEGKWDYIRRANGMAQNFIGKGKGDIRALTDVQKEVEGAGLTHALEEYVYHLHNIDRMTLADRFEGVENKPVFGYSVDANVSREAIAELEAEHPELKGYAEELYKINNHLRDKLVEGGVISQETAELWEVMYPHYMPIRRVDYDGLNVNVPLDTNRTGVNAPIKRATGGNSDIRPLFGTMADRISQTYKAVAKNSFGVELKNTLGTVIGTETTDMDSVLDGVDNHEDLLQEGKNGRKPTFTVFENGERVTFEIDKLMYEAMRPTDEFLAQTYAIPNTIMSFHRGLLTEYNPAFMVRNPIKDSQDVMINSQHPAKTYAEFGNAIKGLWTKSGEYYTEYMENGGEQDTYFDTQKREFVGEETGIKKWLGGISRANQFVERVPRLAEYIASRKEGRSIEVSMLDSARVTTNFQAGGDVTKFLNRNGATFLNASVQGTMQQVRNIQEAKMNGLKGYMHLATKYAFAGIPFIILNGLMWDDDEDYEELSDYVKQNYYVVAKYGDGKFVRIPKGRMLAVIQDAFEQTMNALTGNDEVDLGSFLELAISNIAPNNPVEDNIIAPIIQVANNKTWYGDDLVPTRLQDLPEAEQFDETTDSISKWLGETLNVSPYKINYLLDQYSGAIGDTFLPMLTPEAESGDEGFLNQITAPIRDAFTTDSTLKNQNVTDFYSKSDELTVNANRHSATDTDILSNKYFNSVKAEVGELYGQKREVQSSNLSDSEKYKRVREIQAQINALTKEALSQYDKVKIDGSYATVGDRHYRLTDNGWQKIDDKQLEKQDKVTSDLGISASDYWDNKEEYDYAYENSAKYSIAQTVGGYESYKTYLDDLNDIYADKDSSGKTIVGSAKRKKAEYINSLDLDYGQKIILYRSLYDSKTDKQTYNADIVEYLNSRDDISYEQMVEILEALDFKVYPDGTVEW